VAAPEIGTTIGNYQVIRKIGEGGMGAVYLAEDTRLNRKVALKFLPPEMAGSEERLKRFEREAKTVAALNHPNIVTIYSVEDFDGVPFIAMELVDGKPLSQLIEPDGLSIDQFFDLAVPLVDAIRAAHERGINHRDLKPANIMVTKEGRIKVLDFGLAKLLKEPNASEPTLLSTQSLTQDGSALGTVSYMAPEQLKGKPPDERADIFALGIVLYQMSSGKRPFDGNTSAEVISSILRDVPAPVTDLRFELPSHLGRIIKRCLEKHPNRRYQTAAELHSDLTGLKREIDSGTVFEEDAKTAILQVRRRSNRRRTLLATVGLLMLVTAGAAIWLARPESPGSDEAPMAASGRFQVVAVLPIQSIGPSRDPYYTEGISEELANRLTSVEGIRVLSRATAAEATASGLSPREIGENLSADYLVLGTVRWTNSEESSLPAARTTLRVVRVDDDIQVWSESYDRTLEDPLRVQTELAQRLVRGFGSSVLGLTQPEPSPQPIVSGDATGEVDGAAATPSIDRRDGAKKSSSSTQSTADSATDRPTVAPSTDSTIAGSEQARDAASAEPISGQADLTVELVSFVPQGRLTIYADEEKILEEDFLFPKKRRIFGSKRPSGKLILDRSVPTNTTNLRIHLLVGSETQLITLQPDFSTSEAQTLTITAVKKGPAETVLE